MFERIVHSRLAVAVPLTPVVLLVAVFIVSQVKYVQCTHSGTCGGPTISALFERDETVKVDRAGAIILSPQPVLGSLDAAAQARLRAQNDADRLRMLKSAARRNGARLVWLFFVALGVEVAIVGVIAAALVITRTREERAEPYGARLAMAFVPAAAVAAILYAYPRSHMNVMWDVLKATVGQDGNLGDARVPGVMNVVNALQMGTSLALIIACALLLLPPRTRTGQDAGEVSQPDEEERLRRRLVPITHRLRNLRVFLYVATLLLVVGVLRMQAVMEWVLSFVKPEDGEVLTGLTSTVTSVVGAFYSLVLAAVYLPSAYVLHAWADAAITDAPVPAEVKAEMRNSPTLGHSLNTLLPRLAALLGPLLAGPFASLLERL